MHDRSTRPSTRWWLPAIAAVLGACGGDDTSSFPPESDASASDAGPALDTDPGVTDTGSTDRGTVDLGTTDRGGGDGGVCPASCTTNTECDPCRTPDQPSTITYCCISGLCISMTGMCSMVGPVDPGGDGGDGSPGDSTFDELGGPDDAAMDPADGDMPPDDVPEPPADVTASDIAHGDASAGDAGSGDAGAAMDATAGDASAAMEAARSGG